MNVYNISTRALQKIDSVLFKSMLQLVRKQLNAVWNIDDSAKIVLVDIEQPEGQTFWQSQSQVSDTLMIAYAKENLGNAHWFLPKPIRVQPLVNLLNAIAAQMTSQAIQTALPEQVSESTTISSETEEFKIQKKETVAVSTTDSTEESLFNPNKYLLGLLQMAIEKKQAKRLSCAGLPPVYVLPSEQRCFTQTMINMSQIDSSQKILYGAFVEHVESIDLSQQELKQEVEKQALRAYPFETILWLATLYSSHGRLMNKQTKESFVRLKQWPNFIILPHYPTHINLAAFMLKHTTDLKTIAARTRVLLPTVVDFFNACQLIGLIIEEQNPQRLEEDKNLPEPKRQLFKGILKRLLK